jgi:hypothetical protein
LPGIGSEQDGAVGERGEGDAHDDERATRRQDRDKRAERQEHRSGAPVAEQGQPVAARRPLEPDRPHAHLLEHGREVERHMQQD